MDDPRTLFLFIINDYRNKQHFLSSRHEDIKQVQTFIDEKWIDSSHCILLSNNSSSDIKNECIELISKWKDNNWRMSRAVIYISGHGFEKSGGYGSGIMGKYSNDYILIEDIVRIFGKKTILYVILDACGYGTNEPLMSPITIKDFAYAILHIKLPDESIMQTSFGGSKTLFMFLNKLKQNKQERRKDLKSLESNEITKSMLDVQYVVSELKSNVFTTYARFSTTEDMKNLKREAITQMVNYDLLEMKKENTKEMKKEDTKESLTKYVVESKKQINAFLDSGKNLKEHKISLIDFLNSFKHHVKQLTSTQDEMKRVSHSR